MTGFSISELRLITDSQLSLISSFYCNEQSKQDIFQYDSSDTTTTDDNLNIIVTLTGKRLKRVIHEISFDSNQNFNIQQL